MPSIPVASADCPSDSPCPQFEAAAGGCGERGSSGNGSALARGGPWVPTPARAGLSVPCLSHSPARCPLPRRAGGTRFPPPTPCVDFPGAPGRFPRGLFARRMWRQRQPKIYFYGRSLWGELGPVSVTALGPPAPSWPRLGRASPRPDQPRGAGIGEKATERNFPLSDCVTFG